MKNFLNILVISFVLLISCAKPTVVNAQEFRRKAIAVTGNTGKNQAAAILFWPALMMTYVNASEAIVAANERSVHLINIMQDKNCKKVDKVLAHIASTPRVQSLKDLSEAYKNLNELYKSGALTEDEFRKEKIQVLGQ
jgi:phage terminase large subunit-like protein